MQSGIGSGRAGFRKFCKEQRARLVYGRSTDSWAETQGRRQRNGVRARKSPGTWSPRSTLRIPWQQSWT